MPVGLRCDVTARWHFTISKNEKYARVFGLKLMAPLFEAWVHPNVVENVWAEDVLKCKRGVDEHALENKGFCFKEWWSDLLNITHLARYVRTWRRSTVGDLQYGHVSRASVSQCSSAALQQVI